MGPVGGLVSARGAKPGDLAGTLGLEAAPFGPNCDPLLSQWTFSQRIKKKKKKKIPQIFLIAKLFLLLLFFYVRGLKFGFA